MRSRLARLVLALGPAVVASGVAVATAGIARTAAIIGAGIALVAAPVALFLVGRARLAALPAVRAAAPREVTIPVGGAPVRVIAVQTGTVSIRGAHASCCGAMRTPYPLRFVGILADPSVGARLPIWTYVIVHPEGIFVVDAGASPGYNDPATWAPDPVSRGLVRGFIRLDVTPDEALPARLTALGIAPAAVRAIVLTHQHVDHTGEVPAFPDADIWTTQAEDRAARVIGALPWRWRSAATKIRHVDAEGGKGAETPWRGVALTHDGALEAFHTPGHTPGSVTIRLRGDRGDLWFIGDTSFRATDVDPHRPTAGIHTQPRAVRALQAWLRDRPGRRAFLPSHDEAVPATLADVAAWT